ncbi:MAG: 2-dehydro-3-deoxygalactonokinase [Dyella sp.]|nr:2-dehydro-3-deoxygalactonokinase [Dyella sp.]
MTQDERPPALLAIDWGSTSLRAYLLDASGEVLDSRVTGHGVFHLPTGGFSAALDNLISAWAPLPSTLPMLACGMVGSAQGWMEVPYVRCPAAPAALVQGIASLKIGGGRALHIVPGVALAGEIPDVMRGEETQVIGAMAGRAAQDEAVTIVLPGTHSKWVQFRQGSIVSIETFMTGELFDLLRSHSSIGRIATPLEKPAAGGEDGFYRGLGDVAGDSDGSVMRLMFSARSRFLLGQMHSDQVLDYLSGLLIGEELRRHAGSGACILVGSDELCTRYARAFATVSRLQPERATGATVRGLHFLAKAAGLLQSH